MYHRRWAHDKVVRSTHGVNCTGGCSRNVYVWRRYTGHQIQAVYEAGYFGFWLHDRLVEHGISCIVTPPSLVP